MASMWDAQAVVLAVVLGLGPFGPAPATGNWLLQCSSCVDQSYFSDYSMKEDIKDADTKVIIAQLKEIRLREFVHREDEFYNKFFSKRQLGIVAQELQPVMPGAVATLPERRWTTTKGLTNQTKNVMMISSSHLLMIAIGAAQVLAKRAEFWDSSIERMDKEIVEVVKEQNDNRRKREEMLEQIVRTISKVEVLQHTLAKTEDGFVRLDTDVRLFKAKQGEKDTMLLLGLEEAKNRTDAQDLLIVTFQDEFRYAVEREARADLVEKRKAAEADVEVTLVKRSIEQIRWEEEQKTIKMREDEKRQSEDHSSKLHQARVAHEMAEKKAMDLEVMQKQEESNLRQEEAKRAGEMELLKLRLQSDERRAEMGVQEAIEKSKIEEEAKIREKRENEDVNMRHMRAEAEEKRSQMLAAITASVAAVHSSVAQVYGSPQNLIMGIGSIVAGVGGIYVAREMAILLREQLNKRLGRPSLVRSTNRRGMMQQTWIGILRFLRLRALHGTEFSDVVLHPKLHQQVIRLANATKSAKKRKMPLQHVMFYGPPGTGKTMVAQRFAEYSGLEYAIMSGGDVAPLQEQAVTELHKLFQWVHSSKKGVLLFIDEADAFLSARSKGGAMSETVRNALTTILYHTGTPTSQFMLVIATNRPGDLDSAVLDRIDESVEFGLPDLSARQEMIQLYFQLYVAKPLQILTVRTLDSAVAESEKRNELRKNYSPLRQRFSRMATPPTTPVRREELVDDSALSDVAKRIKGFSGREIAKLFTSLQTHILYCGRDNERLHNLRKDMLFEVVDAKILEHSRGKIFVEHGYEYLLENHDDGDGEHSGAKAGTNGTSIASGIPRQPAGQQPSGQHALTNIKKPQPRA